MNVFMGCMFGIAHFFSQIVTVNTVSLRLYLEILTHFTQPPIQHPERRSYKID